MAKEYNYNEKELNLIQSTSWNEETGVQEITTPYDFNESLGDYIKVSVYDDTGKFITNLKSNDEELLQELSQENLKFIYRDTTTNKVFIKVNELLRIKNLDTAKYELRFDFLREVFYDLYNNTPDLVPIYNEMAEEDEQEQGDTDGEMSTDDTSNPYEDLTVFQILKNPKFITTQISNSRKEIRLIVRNEADDLLFSNNVVDSFKTVMGTLNDENYGFDYVLNLPDSVSIPINNYQFDYLTEPNANKVTGELVSLVLRLNSPIPTSLAIFDEVLIEKELITSHIQKVFYFSDKKTSLSVGGLSIDEAFEVNNDLSNQDFVLESYEDLNYSSSLDYETRFKIASSSKDIDNININYNEFANHTIYGSVSQKLSNFYDKVSTLETYYNEISSSLLQNEDKDFDIVEELVVNGYFSGSIDGWSNMSTEPFDTLTWSEESQSLYAVGDGTAGNTSPDADDNFNMMCSDDNISLIIGKKYRYQFNLKLVSGTAPAISIRDACGNSERHSIPITNTTGEKLNQGTFVATVSEDVVIQTHIESDTATEFYLDNFSIGEVHAEKNLPEVITRRNQLFENISEVIQNFTPYEKFLYYDGQSQTSASAPGLGPNLATVGNTIPFSIDSQVSELTELNDFDGFRRVYKISDENSDDKYINIFQNKYGVEDKPFFNYGGPIYLSFLYKGDDTLDWYTTVDNSNTATYGTFSEPIPAGCFNRTILETQNNTTESKWHRAIIRASQSYWRPVEGYSAGGANNPITDWSVGSSQIEIIPSSSASGSYPIQLFGNYSKLASSYIDSGVPFTGSVLPAGELFHFGAITGSVAVTSSYITDVKITTTDPTNTVPFSNTFLTSSDEFEDWYSSISASAVAYDDANIHSLFNNLPIKYQEDTERDVLLKFVSLVGEFFDVERALIASQDSFRTRDYNTLNSPSSNLLPDFLQGFGWEMISPFSSSLSTYFGTGESDILVEGNTIKDIEDNTYRKILNNLLYVYKSKGTANAIRALTNVFGYPADVLSVREGGGSLEEHNPSIISNQAETLLDGLENKEGNISFQHSVKEIPSYILVNSSSADGNNRNFIELPWWVDDAQPECIEFIFKPQESSNNQVLVESSGSAYNNWNVTLEKSASTSDYGRLTLNINNSAQAASDIASNAITMSTDYFLIKNKKLWNVMFSRSIPTASTFNVTQSYELVVAQQDKDKIPQLYTASMLVSNSNANTNFTASNLGSLELSKNLEFGKTFTGSIAEIRGWKEKLNISKFKQHTLNKFSTVGNHITSSQKNLIYHFKLNENYNFSNSETSSLQFKDAAFKNIKDYSFTRTGATTFFSSSLFDSDLVDVYSFAIRAGGLNQLNDKKIITNPVERIVRPLDSKVSSGVKLDDDIEPKRQYSNNLYLLRTPQATLNDYIIDSIADNDISDYFGSPEDLTKTEYSALNQLRKEILDDRGVTLDINKWIDAQKGIFSEAFVSAIKSAVPAKAKLSDIGILLEPTILERQKIKNPSLSHEIQGVSGSFDQTQYYDFSDSKKVADPEVILNYVQDVSLNSSSYEPVKEGTSDIMSSTFTLGGNKEVLYGDNSVVRLSEDFVITESVVELAKEGSVDSDSLFPTPTAIGDADDKLKQASTPMHINNNSSPLSISESRQFESLYESTKDSNDVIVNDITFNMNLQSMKSGSYDLVGNTSLSETKLLNTLDGSLDTNILGREVPDLSKKWGRTIDDVHFVNYAGGTGSEQQYFYADTYNNTLYYESQFYFQMIGDYEVVSSSVLDNSTAHTEFENQRYFLNRQLMVQGIHKGKEIGHTRHLPTGSDGNIEYPSNHITRNPDPFHMRMIDGNQHIGSKFFNVAGKDDLSTSSFYRIKVTGENKLIVNRNKRKTDDDGNVSNIR